jgi:hypothetical protein
MFSLSRKKLAMGATVAVLGIGSVVAYAYWTTSGTGTGTASTAPAATDPLTFQTTAINAMYPGDSSQSFTVTVNNTSTTQKVYVTNLKAYITTSAGASCDGSNFLLDGVAAPSTAGTAVALTGWTATEIAASGSATSADSIQFNDKISTDQSLCESATVTLNYVAS